MAISIRNTLAEKLAREVAEESGESMTQAIIHSLEDRLEKLQGRREPKNLLREIQEIGSRCAALPDIDQRSPDEILGYNKNGY
ncbi:MAG: type II toxin-antitoxin system VapB family antitoxin [Spirochaetaceae bacterium]|nr:type II toxin-antitoxin system VapB family antitoxin [Spirochaetaceae bacterium]